MIDVWQYFEDALDYEYATVLNMLGLHYIVNKIFHHRYLTGFWICLEFRIYQCYTGFCRKPRVINVWQVFEYSLALIVLGLRSARLVNMPRLHMVLCKLYLQMFSILNVLSSEYAKVLNVFWIIQIIETDLKRIIPL